MSTVVKKIVVYGASGHARVVTDILCRTGGYEIVGYIDELNPGLKGARFCDSSILGGADQIHAIQSQGIASAIVAIGDCASRMRISLQLKSLGFDLVSCVHPSAVIANEVSIGEGTIIAAGAVVCVGSRLGMSVIVNTSASIDHECDIADGVHIGPGVRVGGRARVGKQSWVGIGATLIDKVEVGEATVIGAGSVVLKNIPAGVVAYGVPAQIVRKVQ